ncbi:MAG: hypothetical protein AAGI91_13885 [Bacteroidota bacterium]
MLEGKVAQIEQADGTRIAAWSVVVAFDSVRFATESGWDAVPAAQVKRVTYGQERVSLGESIVGGALTGIVLAALATAGDSGSGVISDSEIIGALTAVGAGIGMVLGLVEQVGSQDRVVYEGPVSRYGPAGNEGRR